MYSASDSDTFGAAGESSPPPASRPRNSEMKPDDDEWPTEVRTLFVCGLAMDSKPRELYLLFRGYKVCVCLPPLSSRVAILVHTPHVPSSTAHRAMRAASSKSRAKTESPLR